MEALSKVKVPAQQVADTRRYIRVVKGGSVQSNGLHNLRCELRQGDTLVDSIVIVSGQPNNQVFMMNSKRPIGQGHPFGEGYYKLGMPEWKNGRDNYDASWGPGLGAMWIAIKPFKGEDVNVYGFHLDANIATAPGSMGCGVAQTLTYLKTLVKWFDDPSTAPQLLVVNWDLGSVETKGMGYKSFGAAPAPAKEKKELTGLKVAIDVGHGFFGEKGGGFEMGAEGNGRYEWALNQIQGEELKKLLEARGASVSLFIYQEAHINKKLILRERGDKGKNHHIFVSLHHNAYDNHANYSCTMLSSTPNKHTNEDKKLAAAISNRLNAVLGFGLGGDAEGIIRSPLGLFSNRLTTWSDCKAACLVESYFIDSSKLAGQNLTELSKKGAGAIASGIANYAKASGLV